MTLKRFLFIWIAAIFIAGSLTPSLYAEPQLFEFELEDGKKIQGEILADRKYFYHVKTTEGKEYYIYKPEEKAPEVETVMDDAVNQVKKEPAQKKAEKPAPKTAAKPTVQPKKKEAPKPKASAPKNKVEAAKPIPPTPQKKTVQPEKKTTTPQFGVPKPPIREIAREPLEELQGETPEEKFKHIVSRLGSGQQTNRTIDDWQEALKRIVRLDPAGIWADDAQYIIAALEFNHPASQASEFEYLITQFPEPKIEPWTQKTLPDFVPAEGRIGLNVRVALLSTYRELQEATKAEALYRESAEKYPGAAGILLKFYTPKG